MTEDAAGCERLMTGAAWNDFCDTLRAAGQVVIDRTPNANEQDWVEGFRYLTRMSIMAYGRCIENLPPMVKMPIRIIKPPRMGGQAVQSPDQDHVVQALDATKRYRVTGQRGSAPYVHMSAWTPRVPDWVGVESVGEHAIAVLEEFNPSWSETPFTALLDEFTDGAGNVEFVLSADDPGVDNWMPISPDTRELMMRVVYDDRDAQSSPRLMIEPFEPIKLNLTPSAADMSKRLSIAAQMVLSVQSDYADWTATLLKAENRLQLTPGHYLRSGGSPDDRHFEFGYWSIGDGEAWWSGSSRRCAGTGISSCAITGWRTWPTTSPARGTPRPRTSRPTLTGWCGSLSPPRNRRRVSGSTTAGRDHGVMGLRFVEHESTPEITTKLVRLADLDASANCPYQRRAATSTGMD